MRAFSLSVVTNYSVSARIATTCSGGGTLHQDDSILIDQFESAGRAVQTRVDMKRDLAVVDRGDDRVLTAIIRRSRSTFDG
jgi:hypothetical protein